MAVVSERISDRIKEDFGASAPQILSALERLNLDVHVDAERVHAAVLFVAKGSRTMLDDAIEHAESDWRDLLDRADLAGADWRDRLAHELGPTDAKPAPEL